MAANYSASDGPSSSSISGSEDVFSTDSVNDEGEEGALSETSSRHEKTEFGGAIGAVFIMLASHVVLYFLWASWRFHGGSPAHLYALPSYIAQACPTWITVCVYVFFLVIEALFAAFLPGIRIQGLPVPSLQNKRLSYNCNGISSWYITLIFVFVCQFSGIFSLSWVRESFGSLMTTAIVAGDVVAVLVYFTTVVRGAAIRMSGNIFYDFFMGAPLNPRLLGGRLDLKMWAETRVSWMLLFLLTCGAAVSQWEREGRISIPMVFMVVAHFLYANATMKGEECIPTTWDIFYEKWGWMLCWWNLAGVPFAYCFNSYYLATRPISEQEISWPYAVFLFILLLGSYYVWDTSQSQKNRFRMKLRGTFVKRWALPQFSWGTLSKTEATFIQTRHGNRLLTGGWWKYARKIHYTMDVLMALSWGLSCGFRHFLPFFYVCFFVVMIIHRATRDIARCRKKYGEDWDRYVRQVPYLFVPFVF